MNNAGLHSNKGRNVVEYLTAVGTFGNAEREIDIRVAILEPGGCGAGDRSARETSVARSTFKNPVSNLLARGRIKHMRVTVRGVGARLLDKRYRGRAF